MSQPPELTAILLQHDILLGCYRVGLRTTFGHQYLRENSASEAQLVALLALDSFQSGAEFATVLDSWSTKIRRAPDDVFRQATAEIEGASPDVPPAFQGLENDWKAALLLTIACLQRLFIGLPSKRWWMALGVSTRAIA